MELYGVPDNWDAIAIFHLEAFEDVPLDLVVRALKTVRRTCRFFPKPAELRGPIKDDLLERIVTRVRLGSMLRFGHFDHDERAPR